MAYRKNRFGTFTPDNILIAIAALMMFMYCMCNSQQKELMKKSLFGGLVRPSFRKPMGPPPSTQSMMGIKPESAEHVRTLSHDKPCIIVIYANWCGHCKNLKPHWNKMAQSPTHGAHVVAVDSDEQPEVAKQLGAQGYPTILGMKNGQTVPHQGGRTAEDLSDFISQLH